MKTTAARDWMRVALTLVGATMAYNVIEAVVESDAGSYEATVTGSCGDIILVSAEVVVLRLPRVLVGPSDADVCEGETVTLSVSALDARGYVWRHDGVVVDGANGSAVVLDPVSPADAGEWQVEVLGDCGSVLPPPVDVQVSETCGFRFVRGDCNQDRRVDISDAINELDWLFRQGTRSEGRPRRSAAG